MKPGEKAVLLIGVASIAAMAVVLVLDLEKRKTKRWGVCATDVQLLCANPPGKGKLTARVLKCLGRKHTELAPECQDFMASRYPKFVKKPKPQPEPVAEEFNVNDFLSPCRPFWTAECSQLNDQTGENTACYASQENFSEFSDECKAVMVEIVQWAPKECTESSAFGSCQAVWNRKRLECFLRYRDKAPSSCARWLQTVEKIAK